MELTLWCMIKLTREKKLFKGDENHEKKPRTR